MTFLNVWRAWHEADRSKRWCGAHFLNYRNLLRAADIRRQLEFALRCAAAVADPRTLTNHIIHPAICTETHSLREIAGLCTQHASAKNRAPAQTRFLSSRC